MKSIIDNFELKSKGEQRQTWFENQMPILKSIESRLEKEKPFKDMVIAICMHVEPKTAYWIKGLLKSEPKHIYLVGCLGTTKEDTAAYLASFKKVTVLAKRKDILSEHMKYCDTVLKNECHFLLDNGASLIRSYHSKPRTYVPIGANEETRSGKLLIEKDNIELMFPVIVIDDSPLKRLLENAIGVGQSVVDAFMRSTSLLVGGKNVLVIGYGYCGSGVARMFKGLGANTHVYDKNPLFLLKARSEGNIVGELNSLLEVADVVITVTGEFDVLTENEFKLMKDNVIIANSGHYGFEINVEDLERIADSKIKIKEFVDLYTVNGKRINLLAGAAPLNLAAGDGNPIEIMDLGLGLQTLSAIRLLDRDLDNEMMIVPEEITEEVSLSALK